ncbi:ArsR/SmtB family transcription factor [Streptomyces sp. NPDC054956]
MRSPSHAASLGHFLAPLHGGAADLFTMIGRTDTVEEGIDRLLELPTARLHSEFRDIPDIAHRMPAWLRPIVSGDFKVQRKFAADLAECHRTFIQPHWPRIQAHLSAECDKGARLVAEGGVEQLLERLHPYLRWNAPTLEMPLYNPFVFDADLHLEGRGLILAPSFFCPAEPQLFVPADGDGTPVLIYPASREPGDVAAVLSAGSTSSEALQGLLGRTRAAALEELGSSANTTMLAKRIGVSVAAASQHVGVLRQAGLIISRREQNSVWHSLTPLGRALLDDGAGLPA